MKLRDEISKKDSNMKVIKEELEAARKAQSQENLDDLEKTVQNLKVEIEKLKHERFDFENRMKIAEKRVEVGLRLSNKIGKKSFLTGNLKFSKIF